MVQVVFGTRSSPSRSGHASSQRLINGYYEALEEGAKHPAVVYSRAGSVPFNSSTTGLAGGARAVLQVEGRGYYALFGSKVARFADDGTYTICTGVDIDGGENDLAFMASNQRLNEQIGIVAARKYYVLDTETDVITEPTVPDDFADPVSVTYIDGYLVIATAGELFWHTDFNDATSINGTAFGRANSRADRLRAAINYRGSLLIFSERSLEIWENAGTFPFAFSRVRANADVGCLSAQSIQVVGDSIMWLDHNGNVRELVASDPAPVPGHAVPRLVAELSYEQKQALYATVDHLNGHDFYTLTSRGRWSWTYDRLAQRWQERTTGDKPYWFGRCSGMFNGRWLVGSDVEPVLYVIDENARFDAGDQRFTVLMQSEIVHAFPDALLAYELAVDFQPGVGRTPGDTPDPVELDAADPKLILEWSEDGGATWRGGLVSRMGGVGERGTVASWLGLGRIPRTGRCFRLLAPASVMRSVFSADLRAARIRG